MTILITVYLLVAICAWIWGTMACHERWDADSLMDHVGFAYIGFCIGALWPVLLPFLLIGLMTEWLHEKRQ